jgi:hypothetical protein
MDETGGPMQLQRLKDIQPGPSQNRVLNPAHYQGVCDVKCPLPEFKMRQGIMVGGKNPSSLQNS